MIFVLGLLFNLNILDLSDQTRSHISLAWFIIWQNFSRNHRKKSVNRNFQLERLSCDLKNKNEIKVWVSQRHKCFYSSVGVMCSTNLRTGASDWQQKEGNQGDNDSVRVCVLFLYTYGGL